MTCDDIHNLTGFKDKTTSSATIQFESGGSCIQGSFYILSEDLSICGTDHLTGG